ncbi:hypothetical protein HYC85_006305 [Camellia sinensis]|uniref:DUF4220 domain-containing protein n=1 Tax=Camellia sinensis TaxID=4442 RepID=A0A7J7HL68_CAMSI|nr:hypothetical protein HYC85_006305 [Camellia sinensis]
MNTYLDVLIYFNLSEYFMQTSPTQAGNLIIWQCNYNKTESDDAVVSSKMEEILERMGGIQVRVIVWSAYLLADSVATMAAGILSKDLGKFNVDGFIDPNAELTAFWAPLMLVHLGGTDAITAYSLEDNELWRRHSFQVVIQSMTTVYIFLMAWTGSLLSILFILMFVVGLFKYCERVCVLYLSTDNNFRDSIQDITTNESKIMKECKLKELEGYHVTTHQVLEVDQSIPNVENELLTAFGFLDMVKRLFADLIIGIRDGHTSRSIFDKISPDKAFKIIEIELGIIYDLRFTKAKVIYSNFGISLRIVGIILSFLVLMMVSLSEIKLVREKFHEQHHHRHSNIDFTITLILLSVALLVELWAFKQLLVSDQTTHWLIKHEKTIISRAIKCILPSCESSIKTKRRWSYSMKQYSLLNFSMRLKEKPLPCRKILKMLRVDKALEIQLCKTSPVSVGELLRERVFTATNVIVKNWLGKHNYDTDLKALYGRRGCRTLEYKQSLDDGQCPDLKWSIVDLEFDQSILVWHLATEILYQYDKDFGGYYDLDKELEKGNWLSQYMLYLLVEHPYMLPLGMGHIKFQDIYYELGDIIEQQLKANKNTKISELLISKGSNHEKLFISNYKDTKLGGRSNLLILHGCKLASQLKAIDDTGTRWRFIVDIWIEMLGHAASQCRGRYHAQQLRRGGEFLTHVWLLMAHFGLNDLFQVRRGGTIADAILM